MATFVCQSKAIYDAATPGYKMNSDNLTEAFDIFSKEISDQMTQIEDFFQANQGDVKDIYEAVHENKYPYNEISGVCTKTALKEYKDYFAGMRQFVEKVFDLKGEDNVNPASVEGMIAKVIERDKEYTDGLFEAVGNAKLDVSTSAFETMVELVDEMKNSLSEVGDIVGRVENCDAAYCEYAKQVAFIVMESLRYFYMRELSEAFSTYTKIMTSMQNRTSVNGESVTPKYQLF